MNTKKIATIAIPVVLLAFTLFLCRGLISTWWGQTFNRAAYLVANEEEVRKECQKYRTNLEAQYADAKSTYTQELVLTVQDLSNVASLSTEAKSKVNEEALKLIFANNGQPDNTDMENFVLATQKYGIEYDKVDDELYRDISRAIRDGRFKFNQSIKEFNLKKEIFQNYINDTRVEVLGTNEILDMASFKGCFNSVGGTVTYNNADEYFAQFIIPTTQQTEDAFSNDGFDGPILNDK